MHDTPVTCQVLTNLSCNLDCTYCYERKNARKNSLTDAIAFVDATLDANPDKHVQLDIIGGESLLYPDMVDSIISHYRKRYVEQGRKRCPVAQISTNGTLLGNPRVREVLQKHAPVLSVGVSVDGVQEVHDRFRVFVNNGKGSYETIVSNLEWLFATIPNVGCKATFTQDTVGRYAECVKHLIDLGFKEIAANVIYEEPCTLDMAPAIAESLCQVVDYLFEKDLQDSVTISQIGQAGDQDLLNPLVLINSPVPFDRNYCGSCKHMLCLGFDKQLFGCNRFCTMQKPDMAVGELKDGKLCLQKHSVADAVEKQPTLWPEECSDCPFIALCSNCSAIPFEETDGSDKGVADFLAEKRSCGWTHALMVARHYYRTRKLRRSAQTI